jgi:hypothetical protein
VGFEKELNNGQADSFLTWFETGVLICRIPVLGDGSLNENENR